MDSSMLSFSMITDHPRSPCLSRLPRASRGRPLSDLNVSRPSLSIRLLSYKHSRPKTPLCFQSLTHSFAGAGKLNPSPSTLCALFCNYGGGGIPPGVEGLALHGSPAMRHGHFFSRAG